MTKSTILLPFVFAAVLTPQTSRPARTVAEMEPLLRQIAGYQYGASPAPAIRLEELIGALSGSAEMRKTMESRLLQFLQSDATPAGKEAAFRGLSLIGSKASIPVLAPMLTQIGLAEMARYALGAITGPEADEALRKALREAP